MITHDISTTADDVMEIKVRTNGIWQGKVAIPSCHVPKGNNIKMLFKNGKTYSTTWDKGYTYGTEPKKYHKSGADYHLVYFNIPKEYLVGLEL